MLTLQLEAVVGALQKQRFELTLDRLYVPQPRSPQALNSEEPLGLLNSGFAPEDVSPYCFSC